MPKQLVVYYSRKGENHMPGGIQVLEKGNTEYAAEYVAKAEEEIYITNINFELTK